MAKKRDGLLPRGVMRREATGELVCDVRFTQGKVKGKFHATQIECPEEGGFFYDIIKLYERRVAGGSRRKVELNYPDWSPKLGLCELPEDFDIKGNQKEHVQKLILEQARRAARELTQSKMCSSSSRQSALNEQISIHRHVPLIRFPVAEDRLHFSEMHGSHGVQRSLSSHMFDTYQHNDDRVQSIIQDFRQKACELLEHCWTQYLSRVAEREGLERKLAAAVTNEALGIISLPETSKREDFYDCVAVIKCIIKRDGEFFKELESLEQAYKSEQSKCWELRKELQDHNLKSISESLNENRVGEVLHVISHISELLEESPRDVLQNPWVPLFFNPNSNGGEWNMERENLSKILNNSPFSPSPL